MIAVDGTLMVLSHSTFVEGEDLLWREGREGESEH